MPVIAFLRSWLRPYASSPRNPSTRSRSSKKRCLSTKPGFESLEGRELLAADPLTTGLHVFASQEGTLAAGQVQNVLFAVSTDKFQLTPATRNRGTVLLGFQLGPQDGSALDAVPVAVRDAHGRVLRPAYAANNTALPGHSLTLVKLRAGTYTLHLGAENPAGGAYSLQTFLAGDSNGNGLVERTDIQAMKVTNGAVLGGSRYMLSLDTNLDGLVNSLDRKLVKKNVGTAAHRTPGDVSTTPSQPTTPGPTTPAPTGPVGPAPAPFALQVTLLAPAITNLAQPEVTVRVARGPLFPSEVTLLSAHVDVDLNHNGSYADPGEQDYETYGAADLTAQGGELIIPLPNPLSESTYNLRARVVDSGGTSWLSPNTSMQVDLHAGLLGSDSLRQLYGDYVLATTQVPDPGWSSPLWGNTVQAGIQDYSLKNRLARPPERPPTLAEFYADFHRAFEYDDQERVLVNVRSILPEQLPALRAALVNLGMNVVNVTVAQHLISGYLPIDQIPQVLTLPGYNSMTPGYPRRTKVGAFTSEGDAVMRSDSFRATTGLTGAGVTVGTISDSANQVGGGVADSQATGDLGANVSVLADGSPGDSDEGRAMMEIIADVAPGASQLFHTSGPTPQTFASAVAALANAGADIIVDDIGFPNYPFFNDGVAAQAADQVFANRDVLYVSATGNDGNTAYDGVWNEMTRNLFGFTFNVHNFGGGDFLQNFTLPVGSTIVLSFQWDDAFLEGGSPLPNYQVTTDIDFYITNSTGTQLFDFFIDFNDITDEAFEFVVFTNDGTFGTNNFAFFFDRFAGPVPTRVRWVDFFADDPMAEFQGGPTTFGVPAACNAIAVGAVDALSPNTVEPFTALAGPLPFFFDAQGNRLSTPEIRNKPELGGPDNTSTSFFPSAAPGNFFTGASAAAPHVAGAAALLLQQVPTARPVQIYNHLRQTALDVGPAGFDGLVGHGLVQLQPIAIVNASLMEPNEVSDQAINLGSLTGQSSFDGLSILNHPTGFPDYDWYRWTAGRDGAVTVSIDIMAILTIGGGITICDTSGLPVPGADLQLYLYTLSGNTLVLLTQSIVPGVMTRTLSAPVTAGQVILVEVKGRNSSLGTMDQGAYDLTVALT